MTMFFIDRKNDLKYLEDEFKTDSFRSISIIGRRRTGKTTLIERFLQKKKDTSYFLFPEVNDLELRLTLSKWLNKTLGLSFIGDPTWDEILEKIFESSIKKQIILVFDEFQRILKINKSIPSLLQKYIDRYHKSSKLFLLVSGSSIGMMNSLFDHKSALYGRRTGQIKLNSLEFRYLLEWFSSKDIEKMIKLFAVFGGTPRYLQEIDNKDTLMENITKKILSKRSILFNEPENLIKTEFEKPSTYFNILKSIASGKTRPNEIALSSNINTTSVNYFLSILEKDMDLIIKQTPIAENSSKKSIYKIKDNFFNFWFKFIYPNINYLELENTNAVMIEIEKNLNKYISFIFEDVCKEIIMHNFNKIGSQWGKNKEGTYEIDICGINENEKKIVFCECKWKKDVDPIKIYSNLIKKADNIKTDFKKEYIIFAKSFKNKNIKDIKLIDLKDMIKLL